MIKKKIFIGPITAFPSWAWAGFDIARELSRYYEVSLFFNISEIKDTDVVMLVKDVLTEEILEELKPKAKHVVYMPIDLWKEEEEFLSSVPVLKLVDLIFIHSERLGDLLKKFNIKSVFVEHNNRYTLATNIGYKEKGKVLWIGGYEHAPLIIDYLEKNNLNLEIDMLTSPGSGLALSEACRKYKLLGHPEDFKEHSGSLKGLMFSVWTERNQKILMEQAKAGFDIKNASFWGQIYKPPTKAQQFISSGIPFACNKDSCHYEYFLKRGLEIPEPTDTNRWFSYEYWQETNKFKDTLNDLISLTAVGKTYKESLDVLV